MIIVAWLIVQFCCHSTYVVWKKTRVFSNDAPAYNGAAEMYVTDFLGINNKLCIAFIMFIYDDMESYIITNVLQRLCCCLCWKLQFLFENT